MKRAAYLIISAMLLLAAVTYAKDKDEGKYNPLRLNDTYKKVHIRVEWDNPDVPKERRESLSKALEIRIETSDDQAWISKAGQNSLVDREEYLALWEVFKKNKLWEIDSNALTEPRPIGMPQRTFIIQMEGEGEKYFAVDVKNKKNKKHLIIIDAVDRLAKRKLGV